MHRMELALIIIMDKNDFNARFIKYIINLL